MDTRAARIEQLRDVMVKNGDADKRVWLLEFGWTTDLVNQAYAWHRVTPEQQADYLLSAYKWAHDNWSPWIGVMALWTLPDPSWGPEREEYWWAVANPDGSDRPAKVKGKKRGSEKPFQITPACQHRPRPRPHLHLHLHLHLRPLRHCHDLLCPRPRPYLHLRPAAQLRARAPSRAACASQRSHSLPMPPMSQTIRRTSASESGGTHVRARINQEVAMVSPEVRRIANSGEEYRLALVAPQLPRQGLS